MIPTNLQVYRRANPESKLTDQQILEMQADRKRRTRRYSAKLRRLVERR